MSRRRRRHRGRPRSPLPQRNGLDAIRVKLPFEHAWQLLRDHLVDRFSPDDPARVDRLFAHNDIADQHGRLLDADEPFHPGGVVWLHREPPDEVPVPGTIEVVHRDDRILVADKPHFLATTPAGAHVRETALVRLRHTLDLPDLAPAHRLDRLTAGIVLFTVDPKVRGDHQLLFERREVDKTYLAVVDLTRAPALPAHRRSRIVKAHNHLRAREVDGTPNTHTRIEVLATRRHAGGIHGLVRLQPTTGKTHQLRVHMAALGAPILGDDLYPIVDHREPDDFTAPLQLLAQRLSFPDPATGRQRTFVSSRQLAAWPQC